MLLLGQHRPQGLWCWWHLVNDIPRSLLPWSFHGTKYLGSTNLENQNNPPRGRSHLLRDRPGTFKSKFYRQNNICSWWPEQQSLGGKGFCPWQTWKCVSIRKLHGEAKIGKIIPAKELIDRAFYENQNYFKICLITVTIEYLYSYFFTENWLALSNYVILLKSYSE